MQDVKSSGCLESLARCKMAKAMELNVSTMFKGHVCQGSGENIASVKQRIDCSRSSCWPDKR